MLQSLTSKAIIPVAIAVTGFVIVCCLVLYSFIRTDLTEDVIRHETGLADTIVKATRYAMLKDDREMLARIISDVGEQQEVMHVRIFNKKGLIMFSADDREHNQVVDKQTAGCVGCHSGPQPATRLGPMEQARRFNDGSGREVLAITAPIYNEVGCSLGGCHFHPAEQKLLGTLDIGLSAGPLQETLANLRLRMIFFCLMVLALTVGGVSALLRRNVLLPVRQLVSYADRVTEDTSLQPPEGVAEVAAIGKKLQNLAERLQRSETERGLPKTGKRSAANDPPEPGSAEKP